MSKDEIALQITLKILENFRYNAEAFQGEKRFDQAEKNAELASIIYNKLITELKENEL